MNTKHTEGEEQCQDIVSHRKNVMVSKQTKKRNWPISMEIQKLKKEILSVSCSLLLLLIMIHPVLTVKTEWDMKKIYYIHHYIILQNVLYTCIYRSAISTCMIKIQSYEELKAQSFSDIFQHKWLGDGLHIKMWYTAFMLLFTIFLCSNWNQYRQTYKQNTCIIFLKQKLYKHQNCFCNIFFFCSIHSKLEWNFKCHI